MIMGENNKISFLERRFGLTEKRQKRIAFIAGLIGIYINAIINYTHLMSERAKIAYERIEAVNVIHTPDLDAEMISCFAFANSAHLDDEDLNKLWNNVAFEIPTENVNKDKLTVCLEKFRSIDTESSDAKTKLNAFSPLRRYIFDYMNSFEIVADMARTRKSDTRVFCSQIPDLLSERNEMIVFLTAHLTRTIDKQRFSHAYPGLSWFIDKEYDCKAKSRLWFDNAIRPLLPIIE